MKTIVTTAVTLVLLVIAGALAFIYSGIYNVSASTPHGGLASWLLKTTMHASVERRADEVEVPDLDDRSLVLAGVNDFEQMCVQCHGAPGRKPALVGKGLNPPAPDLSESAREMTAAELFWITKHGIRMTGMPAWGETHEDAALWPVVAFMTTLPELDAAGYAEMLESAEGMGHHADDASAGADPHAGEETPHTHDQGESTGTEEVMEPEPEHDHSDHEH
jgi:mono/diheme cytochrome c family protein